MNDRAITTHDQHTGIQTTGRSGELAQSTHEAAAIAQIQARFVMARRMPRIWEDVRTALLKECRRPGFAEVAKYELPPRGNDKPIVGFSIRFVESAIRIMGNIDAKTEVIQDDEERQVVRCTVLDLESNACYSQDVAVPKVKERKKIFDGQVALSVRVGHDGLPLYLIAASIDDVRTTVANQVSKTLRTLALRLIPGDLLEECSKLADETFAAKVKEDPDAAKKKLLDGFAGMGVKAIDLIEYLGGRSLDGLSPADLAGLRGVYALMSSEGVRWPEILEGSPHRGDRPASEKEDPKAAAARAKVEAAAAKFRKPPAQAATAASAKPPAEGAKPAEQPKETDAPKGGDGAVPPGDEPPEPGSNG